MIRIASLFVAACFMAGSAAAEPLVKVVNFTAAWCPNCRVLDPRVETAISKYAPEEVELVKVDMTDLRGKGEARKWELVQQLKVQTEFHKVRYLWDWYGGHTGIVIMVSADTGEPLACVTRLFTADEIADRIQEALVLTKYGPAGERRPTGPHCPPPMRPQG
ncbi:MAG: thioredoxin family protein [Hyphomonas sp.]